MLNPSEIKLTPKQLLFCEAYLRTLNGTKSALEAGYSKTSASTIASQNLKKSNIDKYIKERMQKKLDEKIASADRVLEFYTDVMRGEVQDAFGMEASLDTRLDAAKQLGKRHGLDKIVVEHKGDTPTVLVQMAKGETYGDDDE